MTSAQSFLNTFIVDVFNDVLRLEEASLAKSGCKNLSVNELHILDAAAQNPGSTMSQLASQLGVTASTLTIGVKTLEQKGYLCRKRSEADRRKVVVEVTELAAHPLACHTQFHTQLVESAGSSLNDEEMAALISALRTLHTHFSRMAG